MRLLILTILLTWAAAGWAEQVVNIYRGEVLVTSQSAAERQAATRQAFEVLVLRVSGDPHTVEHEQVRDAIERAQDCVSAFNYSSRQEDHMLALHSAERDLVCGGLGRSGSESRSGLSACRIAIGRRAAGGHPASVRRSGAARIRRSAYR